ncbi:hypothetical protein [Virgibacillus chiguensis]|uniref:Uncharacterized protein n=1 Tax=Virgibacillus chiguensis TaxID=411959 RepID=A0A1M5NID8_9BACI|nr:hypothetical protein SAMN05421807_102237 [Virgibacillus chiguensis]
MSNQIGKPIINIFKVQFWNKKYLTKGSEIVKYVLGTLCKEKSLGNLQVIRMEIDYELLTLYDAMKKEDAIEIIKSKERLICLRKQWLDLKAE